MNKRSLSTDNLKFNTQDIIRGKIKTNGVKLRDNGVVFEKKDSPQFCILELDEKIKLCSDYYPIYNWSDRNNGGFWKRTWELFRWGFDKNTSGVTVQCYKDAIKEFNICLSTDFSAKITINDYNDDWLIPHRMGNCNGLVVPKTRGEKILGCDGKGTANITNPRLNTSKGKVANCDTDLPDRDWCACPGYPQVNSEAHWDNNQFKCNCNNSSYVPHFHYEHSRIGSDGKPITCCGPACDWGYEYDCIDRLCKPSLYGFMP